MDKVDGLHFEVCYYSGIEYCIHQGLSRFDPGAQGEHKVSRGFLPTLTWSAHGLADNRFQVAIGRYLQQEADSVEDYIRDLGEHSPYRSDRTVPSAPDRS
jgi:predicted N-acyltransferase